MSSFLLIIQLFFNPAFANNSEKLFELEQKINFSIEEKEQLKIEKNEIEKQIQELQAKIKERKQTLLLRLKSLSRIKRYQWGELLLNSNLNNLNRNVKILKNLNNYDLDLFKEYNMSLKLLASARKNLSETEQQIKINIQTYQKQISDFKKLEALHLEWLSINQTDSFLLKRGRLSRPLEGKILTEFGTLKDQRGQYYLLNKGDLYQTSPFTKVKSVGLGAIIFRDLINRWRETIIVQHKDNYYSVYAGLTHIKKNVGDVVEAGELIGETTTKEFYFELRHFSSPINPKYWFGE